MVTTTRREAKVMAEAVDHSPFHCCWLALAQSFQWWLALALFSKCDDFDLTKKAQQNAK
jgi:hypothetical protein